MNQNRCRMAAFFASLTLTASLMGLFWTVAAENPPEEDTDQTAVSMSDNHDTTPAPATGSQETNEPSVTDTEDPINTEKPTITKEPPLTEESNVTEESPVTHPSTPSPTEPNTTPGPTEPNTTPGPTEPNTTPGPTEPNTTPSQTEPITTPDAGTTAPDTGTSTLPVTTPEIPLVTTDFPKTEEVTVTTTIRLPSTDPVISTDAPTSQPPISLSTENTQIQTEAHTTTTIGRQDSKPGTATSVFHTDESGRPAVSENGPSDDDRSNESRIGVIAVICSVLALISGLVLAVLKFMH